MKKIGFQYTSLYRHLGRLSCLTTKNSDPFLRGKRLCSLYTEFSQTFSILSFQIARREYMIGKSAEQNNKTRVAKTTLFIN